MISLRNHRIRTGVRVIVFGIILSLFCAACNDQETNQAPDPNILNPTKPVNDPKATKVVPSSSEVEPTVQDTEGTATSTEDAIQWQIDFDGQRALSLVEEQMAFGVRIPGSEGHAQTGDWIIENLLQNGWNVEEQLFPYDELEGRNIIGVAGPSDGELLILGAHYDTRPISDRDENNPQVPVPGANDGGSGVAVLLELASVLETDDLDHPIWLTFFDLEDSGGIEGKNWIVGSSYFAESLDREPSAVIIVDMVGDADQQIYFEVNSDVGLMEEIWGIAETLGFDSFISEAKHGLIDDHTPFLRRGIRAVDIIDFDYPFWHTTQDTLDKVSAKSLEQVGQTLEVWLETSWPLEN